MYLGLINVKTGWVTPVRISSKFRLNLDLLKSVLSPEGLGDE